jgi:predicted metal-dependent hydrolase
MAEVIRLTDPPVEIDVRRNPRARRLILRVAPGGARLTMTLPLRASMRAARAFAEGQRDWITSALARQPAVTALDFGATVPVDGLPVTLAPAGPGAPPGLSDGTLRLRGTAATLPARLAAFLRLAARDRLAGAVDRHAAALGRRPARMTLRDPRSRWGSCTADGTLMFSLRLAMTPPDVLDYVAAHEVAHLAEMNHSPDFWAIVERLRPDWRTRRQWLREYGPALHTIPLGR